MAKKPTKPRTVQDTINQLIKQGKLTQKELDAERAELLKDPEWAAALRGESVRAVS